jgi:hypothetical protein
LSNRSVKIGKTAIGNTIITGDHNIVIIQTSQTLDITSSKRSKTGKSTTVGTNPYRGLAYFSEKDSAYFFGREILIEELWQKFNLLHQNNNSARILPVHGPSGCGKSSVVRAGLIPKLAQKPISGKGDEKLLILTPGAYPLESLALALARAAIQESHPVSKAAEFETKLKLKNESGEYDGLRRIASTFETPLIILVDQFEELFSLENNIETKEINRQIFIANLLYAASAQSREVSVIITLRSDFINKVQRNLELYNQISGNLMFVPPMTANELRRAIAMPAEIAKHPLDSAIVELLVKETAGEEGALPLLQFTLTRIWDGIVKEISPADTLKELGGVGGSLAKEAQRLFNELDDSSKKIARRAFPRMVRVGDDIPNTARRVRIEEVISHEESIDKVREVLEKFADRQARIITFAAEIDGTETIRISHEALLGNWIDLQNWLENPTIRRNLILHYRIEDSAQYWDDKQRPDSLLWSSGDLTQMQKYHKDTYSDLTQLQLEFIEASLKQKTPVSAWLPLIFLVLGLGGVLVYFLITSGGKAVTNINVNSTNNESSRNNPTMTPDETNSETEDDEPDLESPQKLVDEPTRVARIKQLQDFIGYNADTTQTPTITYIGGVPLSGTLPANMFQTVKVSQPNANTSSFPAKYMTLVVESSKISSPNSNYLFIDTRNRVNDGLIDDNLLLSGIRALDNHAKAQQENYFVLIINFGPLSNTTIFQALSELQKNSKVVVIMSYPNMKLERELADIYDKFGAEFIVVSSVTDTGKTADFSPLKKENWDNFLFAPGVDIPVKYPNNAPTELIKGNTCAVAITGGVVARILEKHPNLPLNELRKALFETSRQKSPDGPKVINLQAALDKLASNQQ